MRRKQIPAAANAVVFLELKVLGETQRQMAEEEAGAIGRAP